MESYTDKNICILMVCNRLKAKHHKKTKYYLNLKREIESKVIWRL